jgi:hypothetical protein
MPSADNGTYADFERAVLGLAALLCPEVIPCQQCVRRAADNVSQVWHANSA